MKDYWISICIEVIYCGLIRKRCQKIADCSIKIAPTNLIEWEKQQKKNKNVSSSEREKNKSILSIAYTIQWFFLLPLMLLLLSMRQWKHQISLPLLIQSRAKDKRMHTHTEEIDENCVLDMCTKARLLSWILIHF